MPKSPNGETIAMQLDGLNVVIYQESDLYVAEYPDIGVTSQSYTLEQALANLREAAELYLEEFPSSSTL